MTIQSGDIKLLKSQVLLDTPDGGGAMTAHEVVDGVSNNLFPDISSSDRTFGNFRLRKVYAAVLTATTDSYFGSSIIVAKAPKDPSTSVAIFTTHNWTDRRDAAKSAVERYLAKGPRLTCRIMETHYTGSLLLNLLSTTADDFPKGGDAVVIRTATGQEQFVRVLRTAQRAQLFTVIENNNISTFTGFICACSLGQPLSFDVDGPPIGRVTTNSSAYAQVFTTVVASGARFYSTKPLSVGASMGDRVLHVPDIFTTLVPATTAESALVDQYPLSLRSALCRTAIGAFTIENFNVNLGPNTVLSLPTAAEPKSVQLVHGGILFTDDGGGNMLQGSVTVGSIDYAQKTMRMLGSAPSYGMVIASIVYKPATAMGAAAHSDSLTVTQANQGLVFTAAFEPVPAPSSMTVSYMVQGNWYTLQDNGNGRLSGLDSSYGTGTVSYGTGSVSLTLGALPDVGSDIIYLWGDTASATKPDVSKLPSRLSTFIPMAMPDTLTLRWINDGSSYFATLANGVLTGDAMGGMAYGPGNIQGLAFSPDILPNGSVTVTATNAPQASSKSETLPLPGTGNLEPNVAPKSVKIAVNLSQQQGIQLPAVHIVDDGLGSLSVLGSQHNTFLAHIGSINYATGAIMLGSNFTMDVYQTVLHSQIGAASGAPYTYTANDFRPSHTVSIADSGYEVLYTVTGESDPPQVTQVTPSYWDMDIVLPAGTEYIPESTAFTVLGVPYFVRDGVLCKGWNATSGAAGAVAVGAVTSQGKIRLNPFNALKVLCRVAWSNAAFGNATGQVRSGVFRTAAAPLKIGVMQLQAGSRVSTVSATGQISGGGFGGSVDFLRGIVRWERSWDGTSAGFDSASVGGADLSYNTVYLQYVPIDQTILGVDSARLPLDGRVPIYRPGDMVVVHHTALTVFPGTPYAGQVLSVGRVRTSAIRVVDSAGAALDGGMFTADLDAGTVTLKSSYTLGALVAPLYAEHRIEDQAVMTDVQISGQIKLNQALTHSYPAGETQVSSALFIGDLQARVYGKFGQNTWTSTWSDLVIEGEPLAQYNDTLYPIVTTNTGALAEQWALIFTSNTAFRVIGKSVGQIATGDTGSVCAPNNPATGAPYFTLQALGWGGGWVAGNVLRFDTACANAPVWIARTVLQGPSTELSDSFQVQFRGDIDRV